MAATFVGRLANNDLQPRPMLGAVDLGVADDRERSSAQNSAADRQRSTSLGDVAEPLLCRRSSSASAPSPTQAEKSRPVLGRLLGSGDAGDQCGGQRPGRRQGS